MHDFRFFSPVPGEPFHRPHPLPAMASPVPQQMQDRFGQVWRYAGALNGRPLTSRQICVSPGHLYEKVDRHAH